MVATFNLEVLYGQLAIFASELAQPFNDWTDQHLTQGFAWRPGSVSFRTVAEAGPHNVEIDVVDRIGDMHPDVVRAIEVPFEVQGDGAIEVGSISETVPISLPVGSFLLRCEFLRPPSSTGERVRLVFGKRDAPHFAVVRADEDLHTDGKLLTSANSAPA